MSSSENSELGSFQKVSTGKQSPVEAVSEDEFSSISESNADDSSSGDDDGRIVDIYRHYVKQSHCSMTSTSTTLRLCCTVGKEGRFKCGRLVTKTFSRVFELHGI